MAVFAAFLDGDTRAARARIDKYYPGIHQLELSDHLFLIRSDSIAETVAQNIGLKGDDRLPDARGVVFKLNAAYAGFTYRSVWDWLAEAERSTR